MANAFPAHISVCISTYRRPDWLGKLLADLMKQETNGLFTYSIVVADNDAAESARPVVTALVASSPVPLKYCTEPRRSISLVRNKTIEESQGELIAFMDDDEFPPTTWLLNLFKVLQAGPEKCAGVLGPVRPYYIPGTPNWVSKSGLFERPEHPTGHVMPWQGCRTGNVIFRRSIIAGDPEPFRVEFGTGGSDVDFFRRMTAKGHVFIWCNEAPVDEYVPASRWSRSTLFRRALLRGKNLMRHPHGRVKNIATSLVAVPVYGLALPFLQLRGHQYFMRYFVKLGDHLGRLLALVHLNPVKERSM